MADTDTQIDTNGQAADSKESKTAPPYVSYKTLMGVVERMEKDGAIPSQIDKSYVTNVPWGSQNHLLAAFGWLGLTKDGVPTPLLERLVEPAARKAVWQGILRERYPGPMGLAQNATQQQLEAEFKNYNLSAEVQRKALSFFLAAAKAVDVPLSPLFKPQKASNGPRKPRVKASAKQQEVPAESEHRTVQQDDAPDLIRNLLKQLPPEGSEWSTAKAKVWLTIAESTFQLVYRMTDAPVSDATPSRPEASGGGDSS